MTLPGPVPPKLRGILSELSTDDRTKIEDSISSNVPAELIVDALAVRGASLSASSLRTYRRRVAALKEAGAL